MIAYDGGICWYAVGTGLLRHRGSYVRYNRLHYVPTQRENVEQRRCRISTVHIKPR